MSDIDINPNTKNKFLVPVDFRWVSVVLLVVIAVLLMLWQPWNKQNSSDRTVTVTGTATLKSEPDQFVFNPGYEFKNIDKTAALAALTAKSDEVVAGLKKVGVADKDIKTNSNGYHSNGYYPEKIDDASTYYLSLIVTVTNREMSQKVQDYLITTKPSGQVSPQGSFSDAKRKELEDKARDEANKDARTKADKSAKSLGYKIGRVKSVEDGAGFGVGPITLQGRGIQADDVKASELAIQPGENDFQYSVTVVYFVR